MSLSVNWVAKQRPWLATRSEALRRRVPMITKGGLETITQHLAMEYAKNGIRVNAVGPGAVYTPLHRNTPKDVMEGLSPMGRPSTVQDITEAVIYLTDAATVTGHILYVDGGAHFGRW